MHAHNLDRTPFTASLPRQGTATVLERRAAPSSVGLSASFVLDDPSRPNSILAGRAASCLVEPQIGDRVWFVGEGDEHFIIAVLERQHAEAPTVLRVDGDLELRAGGNVRVAGEAVELEANTALALRSDELQVQANRGRVLLGALESFIRSVHHSFTQSTLVGKVFELMVERLTQHSNTSYRSVAEVDQVSAGTLDYRAEKLAHIQAENTSMSAAELVKVDAGQIHLG